MNTLNITKIDKYLLKPSFIQVALDTKWDEAWKISFTNPKPTDKEINDFLSRGGERLAFELFYETKDSGYFLFGSYFYPNDIVTTKDVFLKKVIDAVFDNDIDKFSDAVNFIGTTCGYENILFKNNCTSVVLGILDFWRFYSPCTLLENSDTVNLLNLAEKLSNFPHLKNNLDNTALLEFVCNYNPLHFIGFTVSTKYQNDFELNTDFVQKLIKDLLTDTDK